ncbi:MAG: STAS domain-containing protein [Gaiella sp.]
MNLSITLDQPDSHTAVIACGGDLDAYTSPSLREAVHATGDTTRMLVIDLSATTFLDSSGLGVIVGAHRRMRERGGELRVVRPAPLVARIFELVGLEAVLDLRASRDAALAR